MVDMLFWLVRTDDGDQDPLPSIHATVTVKIIAIIPDKLRDWSRPTSGRPPVTGKALFRLLLLQRARSYLQLPPVKKDQLHAPYNEVKPMPFLGHKAKILLVEYVGELEKRNLIPSCVVYEYLLKLLHSVSVPTPTSSELEVICRLIHSVGRRAQHLPWWTSLFNALEIIRQRDAKTLDRRIHLLLLVVRLRLC
jgi:hypothetical protein